MTSEHDDTSRVPTPDTSPEDDLRRERDDALDRLLRTAAEFDNYRKRTERERRDLSDAIAADVIRDLLPVADDLERALSGEPAPGPCADVVGAFRNGIELIHRQLTETLRRRGVESFSSVGTRFDPAWHEAVASEPALGRPDGEVVTEIRRGYRIGQKLLRPAMVTVTQA